MTYEAFKLKEYKKLLRYVTDHRNSMLAHRAGANDVTVGFLDALEEKHDAEIARLKVRVKMLTPLKEGESSFFLSPEQIAMAKQSPISAFLKVGRDHKAVCIFHSDKHASCHIYGNRYHCFACEADGDSIDLLMKLKGCSFTSAVRFLTNTP